MDSQKIAGALATVIAVIVLAAVVFLGPRQTAKMEKPASTSEPARQTQPTPQGPPKAPAKPGPVVRDLPLDQ